MSHKILTLVLATTFLLMLPLSARADDPITDGLAWLKTQQQADGGFTNGFSEGSDLGTTCDVIIAIAAGGQDASTWTSGDGNSPLNYLSDQVSEGGIGTLGLTAKTVLALLVTGQDPTAFAGSDLIAELDAAHDESTGSYGDTIFDHALVMLALSNASQPIPDGAVQYLLDSQGNDGSWELFGTTDSTGDTNTTALAIQALLATGNRDGIEEAFTYLHSVQNDDGGFPYQNPSDYGTDTDANSTAVVLQALLAAGEAMENWTPGDSSPPDALSALHDADSGTFSWQAAMPGPNALSTAQAIPAVANYTFTDLPLVKASNPPATSLETSDVAILPQSGGVVLLPIGAIALGIAALSTGIILRRR